MTAAGPVGIPTPGYSGFLTTTCELHTIARFYAKISETLKDGKHRRTRPRLGPLLGASGRRSKGLL
eukprot:2449294-Rhodomonas_salina.2